MIRLLLSFLGHPHALATGGQRSHASRDTIDALRISPPLSYAAAMTVSAPFLNLGYFRCAEYNRFDSETTDHPLTAIGSRYPNTEFMWAVRATSVITDAIQVIVDFGLLMSDGIRTTRCLYPFLLPDRPWLQRTI